jgi:hypothetical protein
LGLSLSAFMSPFAARAYEVLLVNKKLGQLDPSAPATPSYSHPLHAKNKPEAEDCQYGS